MIKADPETKEAIKEARKNAAKDSKTPDWIYTDENGKKRVNQYWLADEALDEFHFMSDDTSISGYWYDKKKGHWRIGFDRVLKNVITRKLKENAVWSTKTLNSVVTLITNDVYNLNHIDQFENANVNLINFKNGTYDLATDRILKNSPDDYLLNGHDFKLDMKSQPVLTDEWFRQSFGGSAEFVKKYIGYMFYRSYAPFQIFTIVLGNGGDGKSTLLNYIRRMVGSDNTSNVSITDLADTDKAKFLTAELHNKELNYFADISDDLLTQSNLIKVLTGNDYITAQHKNQDPFNFRSYAKLIFSGNSLPPFNDFTEGFKRRPIILKMNKIDDFSKNFDISKINAEIPSFAYECLKAFKSALDHRSDGLDQAMSITGDMRQDVLEWTQSNDHVGQFLQDYCGLSADNWTSSQSLIEEYKNFCNENDYRYLSRQKLNRRLKTFGIDSGVQKRIGARVARGYQGVRILPEA